MALELEYAVPPPLMIGRKIIAMLMLALGTVAYAALSWPAMHRRGYPPMDHFWLGMTYLWVFPIPLFTLICPPGKSSRRPLALYALATAYIDGCTVVSIVPHRFNPLDGTLLMVFFGPIHLAGVVAIAWVSRFIFRALDLALPPESPVPTEGRRARRIVVASVILGLAAAFPYAFRQAAIAMDWRGGAGAADAAWADHSAYILSRYVMVPRQAGNYNVYENFDANSGLPLRQEMGHEYEPGYKARIRKLLATHGAPAWSHKQQLVSQADLLAMFAAKDLTPVTTYPYDLSPNAVLTHGGTVSRWGGSSTSGSNDLGVITRLGGDFGMSGYSGNAAIGRLAKYPGVIFVRAGDRWVAAVSDDGWVLSFAMISQ